MLVTDYLQRALSVFTPPSAATRRTEIYRLLQKIRGDLDPVELPPKTFQTGKQSDVIGSNAKTRRTGK